MRIPSRPRCKWHRGCGAQMQRSATSGGRSSIALAPSTFEPSNRASDQLPRCFASRWHQTLCEQLYGTARRILGQNRLAARLLCILCGTLRSSRFKIFKESALNREARQDCRKGRKETHHDRMRSTNPETPKTILLGGLCVRICVLCGLRFDDLGFKVFGATYPSCSTTLS